MPRLLICDGCGRQESCQHEFYTCAECKVKKISPRVQYCGRDCQSRCTSNFFKNFLPLLFICSLTSFWILVRLQYEWMSLFHRPGGDSAYSNCQYGVSINYQIFYTFHNWIERHCKFHDVVIRWRRPQLAIGLGSPDNEQVQPTSEAEIPTLPSVSLPELRFSSFFPIGDSSSVMAFCIFL